MTDKYTLDKNSEIVLKDGTKLYRIVALKDFEVNKKAVIKKGNLGGYVQSMRNLSQNGGAWIGARSVVRGSAFVCGDAYVGGKSEIWGEAYITGEALVRDSKVCDNAIICDACQVYECILTGNHHVGSSSYMSNCHFGKSQNVCDNSVYNEVFAKNDAMVK